MEHTIQNTQSAGKDMVKFSVYRTTDAKSPGFNLEEYSRFKFGSKDMARKFGTKMAAGLFKSGILSADKPIVVCASPYQFIPTATFALKDYLIQGLNSLFLSQDPNFNPVQEARIYRESSYPDDYGQMDAARRMELIGKDRFHTDREYLLGKQIIFLDDIYITGGHQKVMMNMVERLGIQDQDIIMAYFAELADPSAHPSFENECNHAYVKDLISLSTVMNNEDFIFNTRVVKYILRYEDLDEFKMFIVFQPYKVIHTLYHLALGNGYHKEPLYHRNLEYIRQRLFPSVYQMKDDIKFLKLILPEYYMVYETTAKGGLYCKARLNDGLKGMSDELWKTVCYKIKSHFSERLIEIRNNSAAFRNYIEFTIYFKNQ
jgi:hypothetical protein